MYYVYRISLVVLIVGLSACITHDIDIKDSGPVAPLSVDHIAEPVPRYEPRTRAGNSSPYTVLGHTYRLLDDPRGYSEKGDASWYGNKFHGRRTANSEVYDMYGMTAAHKTLPIPSYVRVTNMDNQRSVIVRVNDRGPFHEGRIIDLSYTAARKLGIAQRGTAPVQVDYIDVDKDHVADRPSAQHALVPTGDGSGLEQAPAPNDSAGYRLPDNTFLQVGAFSDKNAALTLQKKVEALTSHPVVILGSLKRKKAKPLYRVQIGPLSSNLDVMGLRQALAESALAEPHVVYQ